MQNPAKSRKTNAKMQTEFGCKQDRLVRAELVKEQTDLTKLDYQEELNLSQHVLDFIGRDTVQNREDSSC
jgi:hypothetical protein